MAKRKRTRTTKRARNLADSLLGPDARKVQPKLRMIANASSRVNALRAVRSASVSVTNRAPDITPTRLTGRADIPISSRQLKPTELRGVQRKLSSDILVNVFIDATDASAKELRALTKRAGSHQKGNLITATVSLSELAELSKNRAVSNIHLGDPVSPPRPTTTEVSAASPDPAVRAVRGEKDHLGGEDVIIGIIDVNGFDFSHPDFLDAKGKTRFISIWDQAGDVRPNPQENKSAPFAYGAEFTARDLNAAISASRDLHIPAYEIERQSQLVPGSHGTHVASIAAGNRGICRRAKIAAVLIALPEEDLKRRKSFYDSTRIAHAVEYLLAIAGNKPISINISLGTNGHAHDGSAAVCRWIDSALSVPGRCVSVAAGNAGQDSAEFPGDRAYVMGRIHTAGQIAARDLANDIDWIVAGNGIADVSENELELWYGAQDRFSVSLLPPGPPDADRWIGPVSAGEFIENFVVPDTVNPDARDGSGTAAGGCVVSIYNELYHPANGSNCISLYLSPFYAPSGPVGIPAGTWTVRLHGEEVRDGSYHGWIERDDPRSHGRAGVQDLWSFPSFFSQRSNVDNSSVSTLACGRWIVAVANLDEKGGRINVTSSQGPTRDTRCKPEVAAPGTDIVAAKGFAGKDDLWISMTGTSMASPFVAGVAGLMLAVNPKLTSAQIAGIIQRTSRPLPGGKFAWANDAGYGAIDPHACVAEARATVEPKNLNPSKSPKRK